ncbi:WD40 repeat-like protein [Saccharata proteae CBS 121410]|uniref:WD40 repeat-like protein n=1 Tax=Saccharata proteae CBS 121410 TaxID=1314787 RepID=A0A9P4HQ99_9PEZI|nr:WD40 repeat-like protein [Saccharata proteae CBS 121410]
MVKSYVKYEHSHTFGVVNSASSNVVWTSDGATRNTGAGHAYVGANEEVLCWDVKKGELLSRWHDRACKAEVTAIAQSKTDPDVFAVGYGDGSIRVWDSRISEVIISFNGHKSAITTLSFDDTGVRLASGSRDTDIIVWDLVAEVGLFKLRGHKDQITGLRFLQLGVAPEEEEEETTGSAEGEDAPVFLLSTGKDALIKIWDVNAQHCIETHVAQTNGECWAMGLSPDGSGCITAGNDGEVKVWAIDQKGLRASSRSVGESTEANFLLDRGTIYRQGKDRTLSISFHPRMDYVAIHGSEKAVELFRIRSGEEVKRSLTRKRKRRKEKLAAKGEDVDMADGDENADDISKAEVSDVFVPYVIVRTGGKVRSMDWVGNRTSKNLQLLVATTNNLIEDYSIPTKEKTKKAAKEEPPEYSRTFSVDLPGHRTDVRALALSSDDRMLASASSGSLKIWNVKTQTCLRTLECGYALCCTFLPGDKIVLVGTKSGELELFDIASSALIDTVQAHEGAIWTLAAHPDGRSVVTGSADKTAKFWNFEIVQEEIPGTKRTMPKLKLVHSRTLKVNDDILSLCFSPDSRLLAVATLDNTVKVFFVDSLKLFLNLYGHKLPVLNMSISSDSKLIATCSADKNVRLWGLDFGDCHKAFFAHTDSIMQVAFIPHPVSREETHHFFTASKDRMIKTWDGDKFEQIQKLDGHHGEIWAMAVSRTGDFFVTASHDKSIRVWNQSDEPIFLEEERERELEELYESTLATNLDKDANNEAEDGDEVGAASKQTIATLTAGERIVEALELGLADLEIVNAWKKAKVNNPNMAPPQRDPTFLALGNVSAERHVLNTIAKIPAAQLHDALLVLPFSTIPGLFTFVSIWVRRQWNMPLACRVLFFMLKTHNRQLVASKEMKVMMEGIREDLRNSLQGIKDTMGFNIAALRLEDVEEGKEEVSRKKRAFVDVA